MKKLAPSRSGIDFINQLQYSDSLSVLEFEYMFNGAGVGVLDVNNDGLLDIFFAGNMVSSKLYLNKGNMEFEDITKQARVETSGWIYGVTVVDINNDGHHDIYLNKAGNRKTSPSEMKNIFFINNGNGTFTDKAADMGLDDDGYDVHSSFFDYDRDGDLDMYLLRNAFVNYNRNTAKDKRVDGGAPSTDKLFRNNGDMTFTDVSGEAGITIEGFGLGATVCDINNDSWPDVYVSNDFLTNDLLWINNGNGTFTNKAGEYLGHQSYNGMGNDVADYNNDGLQDIMVVDMLPPDNKRWKLTMRGNTFEEFRNALSYGYEPQYVRNTLQLNNGNGSFSEIGQLAGVHATEWSWAPLFADLDNDGYKDLYVSNGYRQDITNLDFIRYGKNALFVGTPDANRNERLEQLKKFPGIQVHSYVYANNRDLTFTDMSEKWGMTDPSYANGAAYADLDNDGDLDLVVNKLDQVSAVYQNTTKNSNWLRIAPQGPVLNKQGIGTRVDLWQQGKLQSNYFTPSRGYLSSMEPIIHFGLSSTVVDSIIITWPDGITETIKGIKSNQVLQLSYNTSGLKETGGQPVVDSRLFENTTGVSGLHEEDDFVDFKSQPLLPKMYSREGPSLAVGDVNGDGLDDYFAGQGAGKMAAIFVQTRAGNFLPRPLGHLNTADNMGALFFDADGDGDVDLYVAGGGAAYKKQDSLFRHHFYVNDGRGNFTDATAVLPIITSSSASVSASDYDRDGDLDLFVCGRIRPGEYPLTPVSFLLRNDTKYKNISFKDVSQTSGVDLSGIGMATSCIWTDIDNDNWSDLVVVGEFMPVLIFKNTSGKFQRAELDDLKNTHGWWNSIVAGDFDKDGDMDLVAGNLGLNAPYKTGTEEPLCIYAADYDNDGRIDPVMCHFLNGEEFPVHSRDDINRQMTPMRARFRTYEAYATVTFRKAFRKDEIDRARVFKTETFHSVYIENKGNLRFEVKPLSLEAQFAPIYGMLCNDFNGDGHPDVLCVGNSYSTEVQTGRYDAQGTLLLVGDGKGHLFPDRKTLHLRGDNKSVVMMRSANQKAVVLIGSNADSIKSVQSVLTYRHVPVNRGETYALITNKDNSVYRQDISYGQSYLSQSSPAIFVSPAAARVEIYSTNGSKRELKF